MSVEERAAVPSSGRSLDVFFVGQDQDSNGKQGKGEGRLKVYSTHVSSCHRVNLSTGKI